MPDYPPTDPVEAAALLTRAVEKPPRWPYTSVCASCTHPAHEHLLADGGDLREGPYRCDCGCEQPQDGAFIALSRQQWRQFSAYLGRPCDD